jgi:hypothetical protein
MTDRRFRVACPTCGAPAGEPCCGRQGPNNTVHKRRRAIRHIPDAARPGYTYCGQQWRALWNPGNATIPVSEYTLAIIDIARDCIEDAECRACQRSDDRRTREAYQREVHDKAIAQRAKTVALRNDR